MSSNDDKPLDFADISSFLETTGSLDQLIVGGQAVALWTKIYAGELRRANKGMLAVSKDLDFHGTRADARALGKKLRTAPHFAGMDEATPTVAVLTAKIGARDFDIDIINNVLGVDHRSLKKLTIQVEIALTGGAPVRIKLLHPAACLISRATNILSPATARRDSLAFAQMKAAMDVAKAHIRASLKSGDWKDVKLTIDTLSAWLLKPETYVMRTKTTHDALDVLKYALRLKSIDERYRERTLRPLIEKIEQRRARAVRS